MPPSRCQHSNGVILMCTHWHYACIMYHVKTEVKQLDCAMKWIFIKFRKPVLVHHFYSYITQHIMWSQHQLFNIIEMTWQWLSKYASTNWYKTHTTNMNLNSTCRKSKTGVLQTKKLMRVPIPESNAYRCILYVILFFQTYELVYSMQCSKIQSYSTWIIQSLWTINWNNTPFSVLRNKPGVRL